MNGELVTDLQKCHDTVSRDLKEFADFLDHVAQANGNSDASPE